MKAILLLTLLISFSSNAGSKEEINHLIKFVQQTECTYERNGDMHTGIEAVEHIKKKYDYFIEDIESTEDFIKYAATKSKMSGKYYLVHCPSKAIVKSKDWLLDELQRFRTSNQ
jgi:flagellar biosynthesis regulator FlaF